MARGKGKGGDFATPEEPTVVGSLADTSISIPPPKRPRGDWVEESGSSGNFEVVSMKPETPPMIKRTRSRPPATIPKPILRPIPREKSKQVALYPLPQGSGRRRKKKWIATVLFSILALAVGVGLGLVLY